MTTTSPPDPTTAPSTEPAGPAAAAPPGRAPDRARRRRRWHRVVIPLGVAAALLTTTLVTREVDQPDPDPGLLAPTGSADVGGSRLAAELRARGVTVERVTTTPQALGRAAGGGVTIFVPTPGLVHPAYWQVLVDPAENVRVLLVDPPPQVLSVARVPLVDAGRRWATGTAPSAAPDGRPCRLPEISTVGPAAVFRQRYADPPQLSFRADLCFAGGVARSRWRGNDMVVVGASDPFRNDRIDEWHNRDLAAGLLGVHRRVLWLDLAGPEPVPPAHPDGELEWSPPPGGYDPAPGSGDGDGSGSGPSQGSEGSQPWQPEQRQQPDDRRADGPDNRNPLADAFPPWFWALLVQLALALLIAALWRSRRLGPPVPEPLPVTVPAAETTIGRGRLYHRARAYGPTAGILRAAALHRLGPVLNLTPETPEAEVVRVVAANTGRSPDDVHHLLFGPDPTSNPELLDLARALDHLIPPAGQHPPHPPRHDHFEGETR
ncbi:DUF4350 domain-containing protein [Plantactinospora sp. B5E13]|uniref:DUF4350 domain-containing protein n=1 Tax=unclassified Plantactinospora TaxID=2631981 RepID=UPI00325EDA83